MVHEREDADNSLHLRNADRADKKSEGTAYDFHVDSLKLFSREGFFCIAEAIDPGQ